MKKDLTVVWHRLEMQWLHRQISAVREKVEAKLKEQEDKDLRMEFETLTKLAIAAKDHLNRGDEQRLNMIRYKEELEEAITFVEEPEAVIEARKRLDSLPSEEEYKITFDRETAKFVRKLLDREITWIRETNLPNIEKRDASAFTDAVMTKSYYLNKAKRAKAILEEMLKDLERELV